MFISMELNLLYINKWSSCWECNIVELVGNPRISLELGIMELNACVGVSISSNVGSVVDDDFGEVNDGRFWPIHGGGIQPWEEVGAVL